MDERERREQSEEGKGCSYSYSPSVSGVLSGCKRVVLIGAVPSGNLNWL